jgi:7 transmembrane helices usually fused to an inactive transglutaminase
MPDTARRIRLGLAVVALVAIAFGIRMLRDDGAIPPGYRVADLPDAERPLVVFLLLMPLAALVCSIVRNVIGLHTFGTFAPALLGLAFRETSSPLGLFLLLVVLSIGWMLRRAVGSLSLLQVSRSAVMLGLVVAMLVGYIFWSNARGQPVALLIPFLPLVIVTGLIERFWLMEEEDGLPAAVRTMGCTLITSALVYGVVRIDWIVRQLTDFPETLALVLAAQIVVGRYLGYRLTEVWRFRE